MNWSQLFRRKSATQILEEVEQGGRGLKRALGAGHLTMLGIGAIIGAGLFSSIGQMATGTEYADGTVRTLGAGPAIVLSFVVTAIACGFAALCYAEIAAMVPVAGSAYTYAYVAFGELIAWIIGWDLVLEYAIGNIGLAISWSDYFTGFLAGTGLKIPDYLTMDFLSAARAHQTVQTLLANGKSLTQIFAEQPHLESAFTAWTKAPALGPLHLVADLPALLITAATTVLVYVGIKESRNANNFLVVVKLAVVLAVIAIGFFYVNPANWLPFAPNGLAGITAGVAAVF